MELLEIVKYWSYWDEPIPQSFRRTVRLPAALDPKTVLAIQGVRRCGKSTLLTQLIAHFKLEKANCLLLNFEDPRLVGHLNPALLDETVKLFSDMRRGPLYFFFDEIQNVEHWERWLNHKIERPGREHFVITG